MMPCRFLGKLARAERGTATIEFALLSVFFFGVATVALDFAAFVQQKLKLGHAVEQGAIVAFNMRDAIDPVAVATFVKATAGLPTGPAVTCNDGTCAAAPSRASTAYRCIDQATGAIGGAALSAGASCVGGGNAGYYLKIVATKRYRPMIVPDRWLDGTVMTQTAVVRLS
ncbi:TadE/TadG family type IV pilus assembly protein [Sphingomonas sp.]|uniref:TadE/TadG family type IV pilus assembly protein n=1 Tax=Sphingomonas sp. TaxID=28214 RepID=UPI003B3B62A9